MPLSAGDRVGPYQILAAIGAGGMGEVYRARDERLGRDVALKVLPPAFQGDAERLRRFTDEARAAGALSHPGILAVHDIGIDGGAPFIVTELLEGQTLRERLLESRLPLKKAMDIAVQIAQALAAAHDKNIVHRDLKPENLFVCDDGRVKILDFGLAKALTPDGEVATASTMAAANVTASGAVLGTSGYMAPEQVRGEVVDRRADLFAFGAVLYEMLSGRPAFPGATHVERGYAVLKDEPPPLPPGEGVPSTVEAIVRRCLEKRPSDRFQSARDLAFSLQALSTLGTASQPSLHLPAPATSPRARAVALAIVVGTAAAVAAAGVGFLAGRGKTTSAAPAMSAATATSAAKATSPAAASAAAPSFQRLIYRRGTLRNARFAPDGKRVVVSALFDGEAEHGYEILPGRTDLRVLTGPGDRVLDVSPQGQLALAVPGPDGTTLSFATAEPGAAPRSLVARVVDASYDADGQKLALAHWDGGKLLVEWPQGKVVYETQNEIAALRVSPRGDAIAFIEHTVRDDDRGHVVTVDAAGAKRAIGRDWYSLNGLAFGPGGHEVWISASVGVEQRKIYGLALDGEAAAERVVAAVPGDVFLLDVDAGGRALVGIWSVYNRIIGFPPGATKARDLAWYDRDELMDFTPDGKLILFYDGSAVTGTTYQVFMRPTGGEPAARIGTGRGFALSADGKLALVSPEPPWKSLALLPTGLGEPRIQPAGQISDYAAARFTSRSDRWVVLGRTAGQRDFRLWVEDDGKPPVAIGPDRVFGLSSVSPDDKWIAARTAEGTVLVPLDGSQVKPVDGLGTDVIALGFTADGKGLIIGRRDQGVFSYELATKKSVPIFASPLMASAGQITTAFFTRDAKAWVYETKVASTELYLIEGLR